MKLAFSLPMLLVPLVAGTCCADSLVITYRSGASQTVTLNEEIGNISRTEFRSASSPAPGPARPDVSPPAPQPKTENQGGQAAPAKGGIRFRWAPPLSE